MQLRTRLLLGYTFLVVLLLLTAGVAALVFLGLGRGIDRVLKENFRSVKASTRMIHALERQDSLTLLRLVDPEGEPSSLATFETAFVEALAEAEANVTVAEETAVLDRVRADYDKLVAARHELLNDVPDDPLGAYRLEILPVFLRLQDDVFRLLEINHEAMLEADREARQTAARAGAWLAGFSALALLSLPLLSRSMQRRVLDRLERLRDAVRAVAGGDVTRRLQDYENDELAFVARQFNRLLDARDELRSRMEGRLVRQKQLLLGLLDEIGEGALVLAPDGSLLAQTPPELPGESLDRLRDWVAGSGRELLLAAPESQRVTARIELAGSPFRIDLLLANGERPVAWLARPSVAE